MRASDHLCGPSKKPTTGKRITGTTLICRNCSKKVWIDFDVPTPRVEAYSQPCPECKEIVGRPKEREMTYGWTSQPIFADRDEQYKHEVRASKILNS